PTLQQQRKNIGFVELEMIFQANYPFSPPFLRVVYPRYLRLSLNRAPWFYKKLHVAHRFQFRTGHVTIGGSICMELLTPSGWRPTNDIESVIIQIRSEMIAGAARIDFRTDIPYSEVT